MRIPLQLSNHPPLVSIRSLLVFALAWILCRAFAGDMVASGGEWARYMAPETNPDEFVRFVPRGNEIQVTGRYHLKIDRTTSAVDLAPRPYFSPETDLIVADGDAPVFWTRSREAPGAGGEISVRDWTTGLVLGHAAIPEGIPAAAIHLDQHGALIYSGRELVKADLYGEDPLIVRSHIPNGGLGATIAAGERWVVVYSGTGYLNQRIEVYDRANLQFKNFIAPQSRHVAAHRDLMACVVDGALAIYDLPDLKLRAMIPIAPGLSPTGGELLVDIEMVENGLWVLQRAKNAFEREILYYDLGDPSFPRLVNRLLPPANEAEWPNLSLSAGRDFLAFAAADRSTWLWARKQGGPVARILPEGSVKEGEAARFKIALSHPSDLPIQVTVSARSATAIEGEDFEAFNAVMTIPPGSIASESRAVTTLQDTTLEGNESFALAFGPTSGCVTEETRVPVVIKGNGYNTTVHRRFLDNGSFRFDQVWAMDGPHLIGAGSAYPIRGGSPTRIVVADADTGTIVTDLKGAGQDNTTAHAVRDGVFFMLWYESACSWEIPGGRVRGNRVAGAGKILSLLDGEHMLVKKSEPSRLVVAKLYDGSEIASESLEDREASVAVARDLEGLPEGAVVVWENVAKPGEKPFAKLRILDPSTLAAVRTFSWPGAHPKLGPRSKLRLASGTTLLFESIYSLTAIDVATGESRWSLPLNSGSSFGWDACISGNLLLTRGLDLIDGIDETARFRFIDLTNGAILEDLGLENLAGKPVNPGGAKITLMAIRGGFMIASGRQAVSIETTPTRPNVEIRATPFEDNRIGTVEIRAKEKFTGSHGLVIAEFSETLDDLPAESPPLIGTLPRTIDFTADGASFPLDCSRPAIGSELLSLRAMSTRDPRAAAGFGWTSVKNHVIPLNEEIFFTGGPVRKMSSDQIAVGGDVVAVGYSKGPEPSTLPDGVVDLYDKNTGAYIKSIYPPAAVKNSQFGAALAIQGGRMWVGAPGRRFKPELQGRVLIYDLASGVLLRELKKKGSLAFGATIAANSSWVAVGAPGGYEVLPTTPQNDRGKPIPGSVVVFDAATLKPRYTASARGEMLGWSLALDGDILFAGAPLASLKKPVAVKYAGLVRAYSLPRGKVKGRALPILMSATPEQDGHFGVNLAANGGILAVHSIRGEDGSKALQVQRMADIPLSRAFGMPGSDMKEGCLHVVDGLILSGNRSGPMRVFNMDDNRPEFGFDNVRAHDITSDGGYFYWVDTAPRRARLPLAPDFSANDEDLNHDGRTDEIDVLLRHRGRDGLPARILQVPGAAHRFNFSVDTNIPPMTAVRVEYSTNLREWKPLLTWDAATGQWREPGGTPINPSTGAGQSWTWEWLAPASSVFFRTLVE